MRSRALNAMAIHNMPKQRCSAKRVASVAQAPPVHCRTGLSNSVSNLELNGDQCRRVAICRPPDRHHLHTVACIFAVSSQSTLTIFQASNTISRTVEEPRINMHVCMCVRACARARACDVYVCVRVCSLWCMCGCLYIRTFYG